MHAMFIQYQEETMKPTEEFWMYAGIGLSFLLLSISLWLLKLMGVDIE